MVSGFAATLEYREMLLCVSACARVTPVVVVSTIATSPPPAAPAAPTAR